MTVPPFSDLRTPALLLDRDRLRANARRLSRRIGDLHGVLRPHVKTHKCIEVTRDILDAGNTSGITVSTLSEAAYFHAHGVSDILYAVGISPNKFAPAAALIEAGCDLKVTLDSAEMACALSAFGASRGVLFPVMIELDTDGHRSGLVPEGEELLEVARLLAELPSVALYGLMTHAGESYACRTPESLLAIARQERDRSVAAAQRLIAAGLPCPAVSIGSTPTALSVDDLTGVSEVRAGVYATFDLVMAGIGVCEVSEIALSVLVTVTGHQRQKNWLITDGGWMALSRDRGTADQAQDFGYGLVADLASVPLPLRVVSANQEHGIVAPLESDQPLEFARYPIGSQLRVLPNHACATAAQFDRFHVLEGGRFIGTWDRNRGW
jgi:D-serine deaminase-like pyridoxal phosphate-dependent protein